MPSFQHSMVVTYYQHGTGSSRYKRGTFVCFRWNGEEGAEQHGAGAAAARLHASEDGPGPLHLCRTAALQHTRMVSPGVSGPR